MKDPREESTALAALYDLISVGFSYPREAVYHRLSDGSFSAAAADSVSRLGDPPALLAAMQELAIGLQTLALDYPQTRLESEYIALFELNREDEALHLNAHLYAPGHPDPGPLHRHLQDVYRAFGIELKADRATEWPDHLSVQLEFMAYLYRLLGTALEEGAEPRELSRIRGGIDAFYAELEWIPRFVDSLERRSEHPFYVPLAQLLRTLIGAPRRQPGLH